MRKGEQTEYLVTRLRQDILSGALPPGRILRQDELATAYGASRMPIREALRTLAAEGLITLHPNRGALVAPMDGADFREISEMRASAEALAMRLALPNLSNTQIEQAAEVNAALLTGSVEDFCALNHQFHMALYQPCQRPRLLAHITGLHRLAERYIRFTISHLAYGGQSSKGHDALLSACYRRDGCAAEALVVAHISDAEKTLAAHLLFNP
jgi:DNA-binding GntR family transcriptional regulator